MEYDHTTGTLRSVEWVSAPRNLLWTLVVALAFFGTGSHDLWIAAGVLALALVVGETALSRRAARRREAAHRP